MARFSPGQLVHHKRYDYRGVIVAFDDTCQADDAWYGKNRTQPTREQPWYHVVVDGAQHMTYVAEENLEPASTAEPIRNPMLAQFQLHFHDGAYYNQSLN